MIPDSVRAVTIAAADDVATVSFQKILKLCPYLDTSLSVQSVPSIVTPTDTTTPIETVPPIIVYGTLNIQRNNN